MVNQHHIGKVCYTLFSKNDNLLYNSGMSDEVVKLSAKCSNKKFCTVVIQRHSSAIVRQPLNRVLCHVEC